MNLWHKTLMQWHIKWNNFFKIYKILSSNIGENMRKLK